MTPHPTSSFFVPSTVAIMGLTAAPAAAAPPERGHDARAPVDRANLIGSNGGDVIHLICYGDGQRRSSGAPPGRKWGSRGRGRERDVSPPVVAVTLRFADGQGRVRLPKKLIPPIHSGGSDDWWPLENIRMTQQEIHASYRLNVVNRPTLVIDRNAGTLTIDAIQDFNGRCERVDGSSPQL